MNARNPVAHAATPAEALARIRAWNDPALCIHLPEQPPEASSDAVRGLPFVVKDNIDVAGMPTTAGCPGFAYQPAADAAVVARLRAAGHVPVAKVNLDQFATGLVGTRSPYGERVPTKPVANWSRLVLPSTIAPAAISRSIEDAVTVAV